MRLINRRLYGQVNWQAFRSDCLGVNVLYCALSVCEALIFAKDLPYYCCKD